MCMTNFYFQYLKIEILHSLLVFDVPIVLNLPIINLDVVLKNALYVENYKSIL